MINKRNKYLAFVLSLITPGLGHLYIGKLKLAILIPIVYSIITFTAISLSIASTFSGLIVYLIFVLLFYLFTAFHSFKESKTLDQYCLKNFNKIFFYLLWPILFFGSDYLVEPSNKLSTFSIPTTGMNKTIDVTDMIFADMDMSNFEKINRNDIVIFEDYESQNFFVKRVIGMNGERISMNNGHVYINGNLLVERNPNIIFDSLSSYSSFEEILIPQNHFFVLGDFRVNSKDSRVFGSINVDQIRGKPLYIYFSEEFDRIGTIIK